MENTSEPIPDRDVFYYRARQRNRIFDALVTFFAERAERDGVSKRDIARRLKKDPAQITRWLSQPSNLTLDTVSDLLLALDAELDCDVCAFEHRAKANAAHSWMLEHLPSTAPLASIQGAGVALIGSSENNERGKSPIAPLLDTAHGTKQSPAAVTEGLFPGPRPQAASIANHTQMLQFQSEANQAAIRR